MDGYAAILQKHEEELEALAAAHRDALALCEVYEQRIAELEAQRNRLAAALLTAADCIEDGGCDKWKLGIVDAIDMATAITPQP